MPLVPVLWCFLLKGPVIQFEARATPVYQVIEKLSKETGESLRASPAIGEESLFVLATGVGLEELKRRIAEAMGASWEKKSDAEYLVRTPAQEKRIWEEHLALRREWVAKALEKTRRELEEPFDAHSLARGLEELPGEDEVRSDPTAVRRRYEKERALFGQGPAARLLKRLVLACRIDDLAAIGPYDRRLFRPQPSLMQRGFQPKVLSEALAAYQREQDAWLEAASAASFRESRSGSMVSDPRIQRESPSKLLESFQLEIVRGDMAALFMANLVARGEGLLDNRAVTQLVFEDPSRAFLDANTVPRAEPEDEPPVELSPDSKLFLDRMQEAFESRDVQAPSPRMLEILLAPDRIDPLSLGLSDGLFAYAKQRNINLVASLTDPSLTWSWFASRGQGLRPTRMVDGLIQAGQLKAHKPDGWLLLMPSDRWESRLGFTPRKPVAELMKAVAAKGQADIRDYARYAFESGRITRMGMGDYYLALFDRALLGALDRTDWNGMRLFGSFDRVRQDQLENGGIFPMGGLSPAQKSIVERILYAGPIRSEEQLGGGSSRWSGTALEPTEAFANGLPAGGKISARVKTIPTIGAYGKGSDGKVRPLRTLNASTLATIEAEIVGNPQRMRDYGVPNLLGYAPATEKLIVLRVEAAPGVWRETPLTIYEFDPTAQPVRWDQLPEAIRNQIAQAMEQLKANRLTTPTRIPPP